MISEIKIPKEVPMMTLGSTVLFPQAMMPLYIFEPRYREMLGDVLSGNRIFAIAGLDESAENAVEKETPYRIAGIGIIRACKKNPDGSANLVLQGLARIEVEHITTEEPYRKARIKKYESETGGLAVELDSIKTGIINIIRTQIRLGAEIPKEVISYLQSMQDPEAILDISIYTLCASSQLKQDLLETRGIVSRYKKFRSFLNAEIERLKLENKLKGDLESDAPENN